MTDLYEGKPDGRQLSPNEGQKVSRFRPRYRQLSDEEKQLHDDIKSKATELEELFEKVPPSRMASLGMTKLEEAVMWTVKGLTS